MTTHARTHTRTHSLSHTHTHTHVSAGEDLDGSYSLDSLLLEFSNFVVGDIIAFDCDCDM
jgi:hypothetical protein